MESINEKISCLQQWISEKKGENIEVIDVTEKSSFTDYFIICSGNGEIHTKAIAKYLIEKAKENKIFIMGNEGLDNAKWILLDFIDAVVHIFDEPVRNYYKLEDLWKKKPSRDDSNSTNLSEQTE